MSEGAKGGGLQQVRTPSHRPHEPPNPRSPTRRPFPPPPGLRVDPATFARLYGDIFTPIPPMIAQQARLAAAGIPSYLLSNCSELHIRHVAATYPWFTSFNGHVLSYKERSFKPDAAIYAAAEALSGCSGARIVFVDDRADNVAAAAARGWRAVHHTSPAASLRALGALGLPVVVEEQ